MGNEKDMYSTSIHIAIMSLNKGAMTKEKDGTHFSEELEIIIGVRQVSVSSPVLFAIVVDVVTNGINEGTIQ